MQSLHLGLLGSKLELFLRARKLYRLIEQNRGTPHSKLPTYVFDKKEQFGETKLTAMRTVMLIVFDITSVLHL